MTAPKILVFAGSARKDSYNKKLAKLAYAALLEQGALATYLDLNDHPMPLYHGDLEESEGLPEGARAVKKLLAEHDAFLIASPEYNGAYSGLLKNTLDWASRAERDQEKPSQVYANKVVAIMSASPSGLGGLRGLIALRMFLPNLGLTVLPNQLTVASAYEAFDDRDELKDPSSLRRLKTLCQQLVSACRSVS